MVYVRKFSILIYKTCAIFFGPLIKFDKSGVAYSFKFFGVARIYDLDIHLVANLDIKYYPY